LGGWLQRWIKERGGDAAKVMEALRQGSGPQPQPGDGEVSRDSATPVEPKQVTA